MYPLVPQDGPDPREQFLSQARKYGSLRANVVGIRVRPGVSACLNAWLGLALVSADLILSQEPFEGAGQFENREAGVAERTVSRASYMATCSRERFSNRASEIELDIRVTCVTPYCGKIRGEGGTVPLHAMLF